MEEIYKEESGVGEFLLLDVTKRNDENEGPKTDRQKEAFKLSHKCKRKLLINIEYELDTEQ